MSKQTFGGPWTEAKLLVLEKYLKAYVKLMRVNKRAAYFTLTYFDGFAGSGKGYSQPGAGGLFAKAFEDEAEHFYKGSAQRALELELPFDKYTFVEANRSNAASLRILAEQYPRLEERIRIVSGDANKVIPEWCSKLGRFDRALVFLDPYGMQVDWETIKVIASSQKIDLWILVPLGQAINRVLTRQAPPPKGWSDRLTRFFGETAWRDHFYVKEQASNLFGDQDVTEIRDADFDSIIKYMVARFRTVFAGVLDEPVILRNSSGVPLYLLCFAASNPKGAGPAVNIARSIAKGFNRGY